MSNLTKDISLSVMFVIGIFGFISGSFIISALVFAITAVFSNIHFNTEENETA